MNSQRRAGARNGNHDENPKWALVQVIGGNYQRRMLVPNLPADRWREIYPPNFSPLWSITNAPRAHRRRPSAERRSKRLRSLVSCGYFSKYACASSSKPSQNRRCSKASRALSTTSCWLEACRRRANCPTFLRTRDETRIELPAGCAIRFIIPHADPACNGRHDILPQPCGWACKWPVSRGNGPTGLRRLGRCKVGPMLGRF